MLITLLLIIFLHETNAVIYSLNESQYARMPPLIHLDSYEACQLDTDALYCTAEFVLVSDQPSPLLDMIKEYSEHTVSHYNHTKLRYGICVTQTCKTFYRKESGDIRLTLEACLNKTFTNMYELKVNALEEYYCQPPGKFGKDIDLLDVIVGAICIMFVVINIIGSLCQNFYMEDKRNRAIRMLLCFSLQHNWKKLIATSSEGRDPRMQRLKSLHGIRVMTLTLVIIVHAVINAVLLTNNPDFVEEIYKSLENQVFINSSLTMQVFLIISAFLLVYLWLLHSEKHEVSWSMLPKHIIIRWLRLSPSYAIILGLSATWFAHLATGPLWSKYVAEDMYICRQYWWQNILYINNFFSNPKCIVPTWYLAADTQLYYLGVIIYLACRTPRTRIITLSLLFVAGMIIPAVIVYLLDLDGIQMVSPEIMAKIVGDDPHFNHVYIRSYCNIPGYVVGMALAYLVHHWQKQGVSFKKFQTLPYRVMYWCLFPLILLCGFSGGIFYQDISRPSIYVRTAYAAFWIPIFSLIIGIFLIGLFFKFEGVYRGFLEWRGWMLFGRLSYSAYLLHGAVLRNHVVSQTQTVHIGLVYILEVGCAVLITTFAGALIFWLLVEAPLNNIVKECLSKPDQELKEDIEKTPTSHLDELRSKEEL